MSGKSVKRLRKQVRKAYSSESQLWLDEVESEPFVHRCLIALAIISRRKVRPQIIVPAVLLVPVAFGVFGYYLHTW